jgi:hypothetical protein
MAVLQRVAFYPQERLDTPDIRSLEAFSQNDWTYFIKGIMTTKSMVVSGFDISNYANIFTVPGVKLRLSNVSLLHPEAKTSSSGFYVSAGNEKDVTLSLNPSATNFVEMDLKSTPGVRDIRAFWDMGADAGKGSEFTDIVDTVINLETDISTNVAGFSAGKIPLYKIVTNSQGLVIEITDCRPMLFRLGTGGSSPDPLATAEFPPIPDQTHAELETNGTATEATTSNAPFLGGDKNIKSLKQWMDIIMTRLKQMNAVPYWYMKPQATIASAYQNAALTLTSGGMWQHLTGTPGYLRLIDGSTMIRFGQDNSVLLPFTSFDLTVNRTLYVILSKDSSTVSYRAGGDDVSPVVPKDIIAVTSTTVTVAPEGNYLNEDGTLFIKGADFTYESYNDLTGLFLGVYPDPSGLVAVGDTAYQGSRNGIGHYMTSTPDAMPKIVDGISLGVERVYWLAYYDGNDTIIIKDSELLPGESVQVGDDTPEQVYQYIGSQSGADNFPIYNVQTIPNGINLTDAIAEAYKILEKPIYDEVIIDNSHSGWEADTVIYLPNNSKTGAAAQYVLGTDELQIYRDGTLLRKTYDYEELTSTSIKLLRPIYVDSYLRLRISSVGGSGLSTGMMDSNRNLQAAYNNGRTITAVPDEPVLINGSSSDQEVLRVEGKLTATAPIKTAGTEMIESGSNPIPSGKTGLWVDEATKTLFFTKPDGTLIPLSGAIEALQGDNANFKRRMQNTTGSTIPAGAAVYIKGTRQIGLADADDPLAHRLFGFTIQTIPDGEFGDVVYQGVVPNIMQGTGIPSGTWMWLQTVPGSIATTPPNMSLSYQVIVGQVDGDDLIIQIQTSGQIGS